MTVDRDFQKSVLSNGIRVLTEKHPHSRAVSVGFWVLTGSRDEDTKTYGISHLLEHLVFKGTKTKSTYEIAKYLEQYGGDLNAHTTKEYTCYHALVLKDHWLKACEILSDLVSNMSLSAHDFKNEKGVVLQEIGMTDDQPEEQSFDMFFEKSLTGNPIGKPILGTLKSIAELKYSQVREYYKERYAANQLIISAAGNIEHDELVTAVEKLLKSKKKTSWQPERKKPKLSPIREAIEKDTEQVQFIFGWPSATFRDKHRFEAVIVNALLGGGMSSRLFQSVREKKGLAYSIESYLNTFTDYGLMTVSGSAEAKNIEPLAKVVRSELIKLRDKGLSRKDLDMFKTQVVGVILLGTDEIENRMNSLGVNEMVFGRYRSVDDVVQEIQDVSLRSINEYIDKYFHYETTAGLIYGQGVEKMDWWKEYDLCKK